jgi:hypothetical protein
MICPGCNKDLTQPAARTFPGSISTYYCCNEEYLLWDEVLPGCYVIEHGPHRMLCDPNQNTCKIQKVYMDIESDTSIMYRWYTILELNAIPQVTQENFEEKIKTYLLFS